jgi:photosystem II stability/assembly factor-like uncharacterized protein
MPADPTNKASAPGPGPRRKWDRPHFVAAALLVLAVSSLLAFNQSRRPEPGNAPATFSSDWWRYPVEAGAERRLPLITGDLRAVAVRPGTGPNPAAVAVGTGGLVLHRLEGDNRWSPARMLTPTRRAPGRLPPPATVPEVEEAETAARASALRTPAAAASANRPAAASILTFAVFAPDDDGNPPAAAPPGANPSGNSGGRAASPTRPVDPEISGEGVEDDVETAGQDASQAEPVGGEKPDPQGEPIPQDPAAQTSGALAAVAAPDYYSVSFAGPNHVWAVGARGTVKRSTDGGASWAVRPSRYATVFNLFAVSFADEATGCVGGDSGSLSTTADGGIRWQSPAAADKPGAPLRSVHVTPKGVWAVGGRTLLWKDVDPKAIPYEVQRGPQEVWGLHAVFAIGERAWVGGEGGNLRRVGPELTTSVPVDSGTTQTIRCIFLTDDTHGWAVGDGGTIMRTVDGDTWNLVPAPAAGGARLNGVAFADAQRGWAVGQRGTILATVDGGATWFRQSRAWASPDAPLAGASRGTPVMLGGDAAAGRWPAPWYYFSLLAVGLLLLPALAPRGAVEQDEDDGIGDMLASDKPLEPGDPDPLKFAAIALGLSRFLRNENTRPPLTLAITGRWGSGKSSLMNLLRADLVRSGFRPVWFNAWHHQKEEHLLAALLENVKAQAIPPWYRSEGIGFRARLLWVRTRRYRVLMLLLALLFAGSAGYFMRYPERLTASLDRVGATVESVAKRVAAMLGDKEAPGDGKAPAATAPPKDGAAPAGGQGAVGGEPADSGAPEPAFALLVTTLVALVGSAVRGLRSFGADPAKLMSSLSGKARVRDLQDQANFRQRFAAEFRDVTHALRPRDMLILIDDLDRCRPENVSDVLEAVNFLVSSGECFIVLGMDRRVVEHCVALAFERVAKDLSFEGEEQAAAERAAKVARAAATASAPATPLAGAPAPAATSGPAVAPAVAADHLAAVRRERFAREYIEKLVQIQVPVPTPEAALLAQVLAPDAAARPIQPRSRREAILTALRPAWPAVTVVALALAAFTYGWSVSRPAPTADVMGTSRGRVPNAQGDLGSGPDPTTEPVSAPSHTTQSDDPAEPTAWEPAEFLDAPAPSASFSIFVVALALAAGAGVWSLLSQPEVVVRDSSRFTAALRQWHPLIYDRGFVTPRSLKRFLNRVRFLAMRQRPGEVYETRGDRLAAWLRRVLRISPPATVESRGVNAETLAGLQGPMPEPILVAWCALATEFKDEYRTVTSERASQALEAKRLPELARFCRDQWDQMERWRPRFEELAQAVQLS